MNATVNHLDLKTEFLYNYLNKETSAAGRCTYSLNCNENRLNYMPGLLNEIQKMFSYQ